MEWRQDDAEINFPNYGECLFTTHPENQERHTGIRLAEDPQRDEELQTSDVI